MLTDRDVTAVVREVIEGKLVLQSEVKAGELLDAVLAELHPGTGAVSERAFALRVVAAAADATSRALYAKHDVRHTDGGAVDVVRRAG